jgi:hypothetical protein
MTLESGKRQQARPLLLPSMSGSGGAEIIIGPLDTARFWASRAVLEADGKRHIRRFVTCNMELDRAR